MADFDPKGKSHTQRVDAFIEDVKMVNHPTSPEKWHVESLGS